MTNARFTECGEGDLGDRSVYVTQNHEYYCRGGVCVAVVDPRTGTFLSRHEALGKRADAAITFDAPGHGSIASADRARPGARLRFATSAEDPRGVLTSPLVSIRRQIDVVALDPEDVRGAARRVLLSIEHGGTP